MSLELKRFLFDAYGGFSDGRIKRLEKGDTFIIDGRAHQRHGRDGNGNGKLDPAFCRMFARIVGEDEVVLSLHQNAPVNYQVIRLVQAKGGDIGEYAGSTHIAIKIDAADGPFVRDLAKCIRGIIAPGAPPCPIPSYRQVCPQVAKSLERFASCLDDYVAAHPRPKRPALTGHPPRLLPDNTAAPASASSAALEQQIARLSEVVRHVENMLANMAFNGRMDRPSRRRRVEERPRSPEQDAVLLEIFKTNVALRRAIDTGSGAGKEGSEQPGGA